MYIKIAQVNFGWWIWTVASQWLCKRKQNSIPHSIIQITFFTSSPSLLELDDWFLAPVGLVAAGVLVPSDFLLPRVLVTLVSVSSFCCSSSSSLRFRFLGDKVSVQSSSLLESEDVSPYVSCEELRNNRKR